MINLNKLKGMFPAFYAAYEEDGSVSPERALKQAEYLKVCGMKGLYLNGSSGEGFLLTTEERKVLQEAVIKAFRDEMTMIVHVGAASTREAIELAQHAEAVGAHAISAVPSVYYRPSEQAIYEHWTAIINETSLPFIIYNIPAFTGYDLSMELFGRMIELPRVVGIKNSSMNSYQIQRFKRAGGGNFIVYNGPDEQYLSGRIAGADGGIGGTYGAMARLFVQMEVLYTQGRLEQAQRIQVFINECIEKCLETRNLYAAMKEIMRLDGVDIGSVRMPFLALSDEDKEEMKKLYNIIKAFNVE